jgi:hypothetical protein
MITVGFSTRKIDPTFVDYIRNTIGPKNVEIIPIENDGVYSLTQAYNMILDQASNDIVILCHDDIYFEGKGWGSNVLYHFQKNPEYGILGVAGTTHMPKSGQWWEDRSKIHGIVNHEHQGKKWESRYSNSLGKKIQDVVVVDGLFICVNKNNITKNFNEEVKGFHMYDIDFCFRNFLDEVKVGVIYDVRVTHKSIGMTNQEWERNKNQFAETYKDNLPAKIKINLDMDSRIKVLISGLYMNGFTGSEMYLYELSKELSKLNCDVTVVAHNDNGPLAKIAKRLNIKLLKENEYPGFKMGDGKWILSTQDGPQPSQPNVFYKTSDVSFDIIHTQHYPITSKICTLYPTTPKVSTIHSEIIDLENPFIHDSIEDYIAIRPEIKEYLISNFGIPEDKIEIIYNPIDGSRFNESNTKDDGYVLFVGTIDFLRRRTIEDLVEYTKSINKELWVVGKRYSNDDYIVDILNNDHVKHFDDTYNVEKYVKNCYQTAGIQLGRTTIEGWLCGKSGWIYKVDLHGNIIGKSLNEPPSDKNKFISSEVAKKIKQKYIEILNR